MPGWKGNSGCPKTQQEWNSKVYKLEDIFTAPTVKKLSNKTLIQLSQNPTELFGNCFTIKKLDPVTIAQYDPELELNDGMDVHVFVHDEHEEHFLFLAIFPYDLSYIFVNSKNDQGINALDLSFRKIITNKLNNHRCKCSERSSPRHYNDCIKNNLKERVEKNISCTTPIFHQLDLRDANGEQMPNCEGTEKIYGTIRLVTNYLKAIIQEDLCLLPCTQVTYDTAVKKYHINTLDPRKSKHFRIWPSYTTMRVENRSEDYIYSPGTVVSAVGGSMGLFLGFSILSTLIHLLNFFQTKLQA